MLLPRDNLAGRVESRLEVVVAGRAIEVVGQVVLPRPEQLDRRAVHLARNPRGFGHVVVQDAASEAAAHAHEVHGDVAVADAERLGNHLPAFARRLTADPHLELAVLEMRGAVLRLERGMREEGIVVGRFNRLRRAAERASGVAIVIERDVRRLIRRRFKEGLRGQPHQIGIALLVRGEQDKAHGRYEAQELESPPCRLTPTQQTGYV